MKTTIHHLNKEYEINLSMPIDISIPIKGNGKNPIAWYLNHPKITPVISGDFVGSVASGKSSTNFNNIYFNPHAHGTHTECLGHITKDFYSVNQALQKYFFLALLISIYPKKIGQDLVIEKHQLQKLIDNHKPEALIIRTLPNTCEKKHKNYSHTNPPYLSQEAASYLCEKGIQHLLIDLPSVDKEVDGGKLLAHKAFWNVKNIDILNQDARHHSTITEMIFVENNIVDGMYMLNIQIASFENDATPSKPILYKILKNKL